MGRDILRLLQQNYSRNLDDCLAARGPTAVDQIFTNCEIEHVRSRKAGVSRQTPTLVFSQAIGKAIGDARPSQIVEGGVLHTSFRQYAFKGKLKVIDRIDTVLDGPIAAVASSLDAIIVAWDDKDTRL